jgi:hypothetical protein
VRVSLADVPSERSFFESRGKNARKILREISNRQQQAPVDERKPAAIKVHVSPASVAPSINQVVALPQRRIAAVNTVADLNRFRVAEREGINPQGLIGDDYQDQRTMNMARRQGVQYMHNHGMPAQDMKTAASHQHQMQQMQYQFGVQQVNANYTYGIPPILVQAMNQFHAKLNRNFAVGAVQNQEQQWIDVGQQNNNGNPQMNGMF